MKGYITIEQLSKDLQELIEKAQNCTLDGFYNKSEIDAKEKYWLSLVGEKLGLEEGYTKEQFDEKINEIKEQIMTKASADTHYDKSYIDKVVDDFNKQYESKADKDNVYTRAEVNDRLKTLDLSTKANIDDVYTKEDIEKMLDELKKLLNTKMNKDSVYTKEELDAKFAELGQKANINDIYDKNTVDRKIQEIKDNMSKLLTAENVYTKSEIDRMFGILETIVDKNEVYTKEVIDKKVEDINTELAKKLEDTTRYTKSEVDNLFNQVKRDIERLVDWSNYYTKAQVNDRIKVLLSTSDIVDNLTSTATDKGLSANQGRILNGKIEDLKNYASDAKTRIAAAITSQKVNASSNDSWDTLDDKIRQIQPNGKDLSEYVLTDVIIPKDMGYPKGLMFKDRILIVTETQNDSTWTVKISLYDKYGELLNYDTHTINSETRWWEIIATKNYVWLMLVSMNSNEVVVCSYDYNFVNKTETIFNDGNVLSAQIISAHIDDSVLVNIYRYRTSHTYGWETAYLPHYSQVVLSRIGNNINKYKYSNYDSPSPMTIGYLSKYHALINTFHIETWTHRGEKHCRCHNTSRIYKFTDFSKNTNNDTYYYNTYGPQINIIPKSENDIDIIDSSNYGYTKQYFKILENNSERIVQRRFNNGFNNAISEAIPSSKVIAVNDSECSCGLYYNDKWCKESSTSVYFLPSSSNPFYTGGDRWMNASIYNDIVYIFFRRCFSQTNYRSYVFEYRRKVNPVVDYNKIPYYQNMDQNKDGLFKYIWLEDEQGWEIQGGFLANGSRIIITDEHEGKPIIKANNIITSKSGVSRIGVDYLSKNLKYFSGVFSGVSTLENNINIILPDTVEDISRLFYECDLYNNTYEIRIKLSKSLKTMEKAFYNSSYGNKYVGDMADNNDVNMSYAFYGCSGTLVVGHLSNKITNMEYCFCGADIKNIPNIPTSVKNLNNTFYRSSLTELPNLPDTVENMDSICYDCGQLLAINKLPRGNVTNVTKSFYDCDKLVSINDNFQEFLISNKDNITSYYGMFRSCESLTMTGKVLDFSIFNGKDNIIFSYMFYYCKQLGLDIILKMSGFNNLYFTFYYTENCTFKVIDLERCLIYHMYYATLPIEMNIDYIKLVDCLIGKSDTKLEAYTYNTESYLMYLTGVGSTINIKGDITIKGSNITVLSSRLQTTTIDGKYVYSGTTVTFKRLVLENGSSEYSFARPIIEDCIISADEIYCDGVNLSKLYGLIGNSYIKRLDKIYIKTDSIYSGLILLDTIACASLGEIYVEYTNAYRETSSSAWLSTNGNLCMFNSISECINLKATVKAYLYSLFKSAKDLETLDIKAYDYYNYAFASGSVPKLRTVKITYLDTSSLSTTKLFPELTIPNIRENTTLESIDIIKEGDSNNIKLSNFLYGCNLTNLTHFYIDPKLNITDCYYTFGYTTLTNTINIFDNTNTTTVNLNSMYDHSTLSGQQILYYPDCFRITMNYIFYYCSELTGDYTLPTSTESAKYAFYGTKVQNINIPYCELAAYNAFDRIVSTDSDCNIKIDGRNAAVTNYSSYTGDDLKKKVASSLFGNQEKYTNITIV